MAQISNILLKMSPEGNCNTCITRSHCLNKSLNRSDLQRYESLVKRRTLQKGHSLFRQGEQVNSLYIIHSGSFKAFLISDDGEQQITGFHFPGDLLGIDGLRDRHQIYHAEALETSSVCELPYHLLEQLMENIPALRAEFIRYISAELARGKNVMLVLGKMAAERKLATFFLDISAAMQSRGKARNDFILSMQRRDIGNYLNLSIETVSRLISRFQYAGMIKINHRHAEIIDRRRLEEIALGYGCYALSKRSP